ncbi:MAG TPA: hypothetical protein VNL73_08625 [Verrucomicrobiae bacterium]|nr:hypothetical protein [Verrucomicrobiae bacterium]
MKVYSERVAAVWEVTPATEILFYHDFYKGKVWANIRKFSKSDRYTGPTRAGIKFPPEFLPKIIESLEKAEKRKDSLGDEELLRLTKNNFSDLVIQASIYKGTFGIDIREWQKSKQYTGWTKKGIRLPIEYTAKFLDCLKKMIRASEGLSETSFSDSAEQAAKDVNISDTTGIPKKFEGLFATEEQDENETN